MGVQHQVREGRSPQATSRLLHQPQSGQPKVHDIPKTENGFGNRREQEVLYRRRRPKRANTGHDRHPVDEGTEAVHQPVQTGVPE